MRLNPYHRISSGMNRSIELEWTMKSKLSMVFAAVFAIFATSATVASAAAVSGGCCPFCK